MEFNIIKTIVSSFVFVFLLFTIVNHVINTWFFSNLHESDRNLIEKFETTIDAPDYATENSENTANLFDKVNLQLDQIRTLKEPYTEIVKTVNFNRDLSGNMLILSNLKTLVNTGVANNDQDLQTNPGITKLFQYGGNDSIAEIIADMATLDEAKLTELCNKKNTSECDTIESASDRATCVAKIQKQCRQEIEASYIKRITTIVSGHQRIIDRVLKKESSV
jgi:hypothetical protein